MAPVAPPPDRVPWVTVDIGGEDHELIRHWPSGPTRGRVRVPRPGRIGHMTIERDTAGAHRIHTPGCATTVIDGAAARMACAPDPAAPEAEWERLLITHNLAFAAVLRGYEVLNATAGAAGGGAMVLLGARGVGKSSIAAHLVRLGAELLSDEVLALGLDGPTVLAHPGVGVLHVPAGEARRLEAAGIACAPSGQGGMHRAHAQRSANAAPVEAVFFLERDDAVRDVTLERFPDPARLLQASFNLNLSSTERLQRHFEVRAALLDSGTMRLVRIPTTFSAADAAERLLARSH
jgi:hypothetical protein